jgi:hypothetical protein
MRNFAILIALCMLPGFSMAQKTWSKNKQKFSSAQGTLFGYWGYNRSAYTKSNMHFVGPGYDFTLQGVVAHDNPEKLGNGTYINPAKITIPQFNARIGYYFKDHWAVSFGYDHMKYIFADGNEVLLSGTIDAGVDQSGSPTPWSGLYNAEPITTDREYFHYENSDGLNYLHFRLTRTDMLFGFGEKHQVALSSNLAVGTGGILSFNDFTFAGRKNVRTISMSGYGLSAHVGLRAEFFRHVFIQSTVSGGLHHQLKVRNRPADPSAFTRQSYGYFEFDTVIGFLLYIRPTNSCDSCPVWN